MVKFICVYLYVVIGNMFCVRYVVSLFFGNGWYLVFVEIL